MKIALIGKEFSEEFQEVIYSLFRKLKENNAELYISEGFSGILEESKIELPEYHTFDENGSLDKEVDYLFSIGGDGTFLSTVPLTLGRKIPVLGINTGRLGFLANISREDVDFALDEFFRGEFSLEERALLQLTTTGGTPDFFNRALNEITIHKQGFSMISVHAELDGEYLNTYWADALILSTPTGSTAYSLSVGGPIMIPGSRNFIISPVAPHNLTVRPLVVPDSKKISLKVKARDNTFMIALDASSYILPADTELIIERAPETLSTIKLTSNNFYNTLRNKLMWGMDRRN